MGYHFTKRTSSSKKLLEEDTDETFSDINCNNVFSGQSPKAIEIKTKNKKMGPYQTYKPFVQQRKL